MEYDILVWAEADLEGAMPNLQVKNLQVRRRRAKSAGKKIQGEKMPLQLCR